MIGRLQTVQSLNCLFWHQGLSHLGQPQHILSSKHFQNRAAFSRLVSQEWPVVSASKITPHSQRAVQKIDWGLHSSKPQKAWTKKGEKCSKKTRTEPEMKIKPVWGWKSLGEEKNNKLLWGSIGAPAGPWEMLRRRRKHSIWATEINALHTTNLKGKVLNETV